MTTEQLPSTEQLPLAVPFSLSPRDQEIAELMLQGYSHPEIAARVGMDLGTVKGHLRIIYLRAGIHGGCKRVKLINSLSASTPKAPLPILGARERQVAELAIAGLSNPEIAARLNNTVQVVKNILSKIFDKCGVWSRTELAARFHCD